MKTWPIMGITYGFSDTSVSAYCTPNE